jgi:transketolase
MVSMPFWEMFEHCCRDNPTYQESVLPSAVTARVSVELASIFCWERYIGTGRQALGMKKFGASAPLKELQKKFGFTAVHVVAAAREQLRGKLS